MFICMLNIWNAFPARSQPGVLALKPNIKIWIFFFFKRSDDLFLQNVRIQNELRSSLKLILKHNKQQG